MKRQTSRNRRRLLLWLAPLGALLLGLAVWTWWGERNPEQERELRVLMHEQFQQWFPEEMALPDGQFGFLPHSSAGADEGRPDVVLLHGLDEPGGIWNELVPVLEASGMVVWEFRYPNDQAIDRSADLLADSWPELAEDHAVVLIGHSMGGLVIRDFVGRWRHPVEGDPGVAGAAVRGVILVGTPNHGSEWARLRVWLELREFFTSAAEQRLSLFRGLREGTGAAKIDLRPGSAFLTDLNSRCWPEQVPVRIIGGLLAEPTPSMKQSIEAIAVEPETAELTGAIEAWWLELGEGLGDGVVPLDSLELTGAPPPTIVSSSHRGLLVRGARGKGEPPAIPVILEILEGWLKP
jgi:pimeloyl-ACP methyl ester carboxylesterase